jgi:hypothetical protein
VKLIFKNFSGLKRETESKSTVLECKYNVSFLVCAKTEPHLVLQYLILDSNHRSSWNMGYPNSTISGIDRLTTRVTRFLSHWHSLPWVG